ILRAAGRSDPWLAFREPARVPPDAGVRSCRTPRPSRGGQIPVFLSLFATERAPGTRLGSCARTPPNPDFVIFAVETTVLLTYSPHQRNMIYAINARTEIVMARHIFVYSQPLEYSCVFYFIRSRVTDEVL